MCCQIIIIDNTFRTVAYAIITSPNITRDNCYPLLPLHKIRLSIFLTLTAIYIRFYNVINYLPVPIAMFPLLILCFHILACNTVLRNPSLIIFHSLNLSVQISCFLFLCHQQLLFFFHLRVLMFLLVSSLNYSAAHTFPLIYYYNLFLPYFVSCQVSGPYYIFFVCFFLPQHYVFCFSYYSV